MKVEKRALTPHKPRPLLDSSTTPENHLAITHRTLYVDQATMDILMEKLIIQKCENFFQVAINVSSVGGNVCIQLNGAQVQNASEYLKRNIVHLNPRIPAMEKPSPQPKQPFRFANISKREHEIAFIPNSFITKYLQIEPQLLHQCRGCTVRILDECKSKYDIDKNTNGVYVLCEANSINDIQMWGALLCAHVTVYWYAGHYEGKLDHYQKSLCLFH